MAIPGTNKLQSEARRGRGALGNPDVRFDPYQREFVDDGWESADPLPPVRTETRVEVPRKVITRNTSPDLSFDRSINPYRGCEHGCIYCFARPSHAYLGLSPGLDFETKLIARPQAPELLERELRAPSYRPDVIAIGTNTDPYQPIERDMGVMRRVLEVLRAFRHPVAIVTKGTLIERDIDLLADLAAQNLVRVGLSVTTLDPAVARVMEPRVPSPRRRLQTVSRLVEAGIPVRVLASPMIPGLTDHELEQILSAGKDAGATFGTYTLLRLPLEVADLVYDWLQAHFPNRAARVRRLIRETHGGRDYDPSWGKRLRGEGSYALLVNQRFRVAVARLGLNPQVVPLRTDLFAPPARIGDQLSLF